MTAQELIAQVRQAGGFVQESAQGGLLMGFPAANGLEPSVTGRALLAMRADVHEQLAIEKWLASR